MRRHAIIIGFVIACAMLLLSGSFVSSHAALIWSQDFQSALSNGNLYTQPGDNFSEKWPVTDYYIGSVTLTGWTFGGEAYLAKNDSTGDQAILLNESPHGMMSVPISGVVTAGTSYLLTFDHWGDNRPNQAGYNFEVYVNDSLLTTITRNFSMTGSGETKSILFTAPTNDVILKFLDSSTGQASPIIDNIKISTVPLPPAAWLLGTGLIGLVGLRRRLKK
jgi:hypothetical protein